MAGRNKILKKKHTKSKSQVVSDVDSKFRVQYALPIQREWQTTFIPHSGIQVQPKVRGSATTQVNGTSLAQMDVKYHERTTAAVINRDRGPRRSPVGFPPTGLTHKHKHMARWVQARWSQCRGI